MIPDDMVLWCVGCGKRPSEFTIYIELGEEDCGITADEYVWRYEGTLNVNTGYFLCDGCYIEAGMPSSPTGWQVPDEAYFRDEETEDIFA